MNLLFHDRSTVATTPGAATLTIERSGNFTFSAGAVARLKLRVGSELVLAQDVDAPRMWFLLLCDERLPVHVKPFAVRTAGAKNGGRLVFSSAHRATAYFQAYSEVTSSKQRLTIGDMAASYDAAGLLWPLLPEQPVVRNEVLQQPDPVKAAAQVLGSAMKLKKAQVGVATALAPAPAKQPAKTVALVMPAQVGKKPANHVADTDTINPGLEAKLLKLVDRLGSMKLAKMEEHEAKQALQLLTNNLEKLAWVPGALRLLERLAGCFVLPTSNVMEGSQPRA
jgi:hypothetical protein